MTTTESSIWERTCHLTFPLSLTSTFRLHIRTPHRRTTKKEFGSVQNSLITSPIFPSSAFSTPIPIADHFTKRDNIPSTLPCAFFPGRFLPPAVDYRLVSPYRSTRYCPVSAWYLYLVTIKTPPSLICRFLPFALIRTKPVLGSHRPGDH